MYFSLADSAKKVGISRSSIYRLIDEGKLSSSTDRRGKKVIELTELLRVFGEIKEEKEQEEKNSPRERKQVHQKTTSDTLMSTVQEIENLKFQLQIKEMELKLKDKELEIVKERWMDLKQSGEQVLQEKNKLLEIIDRQSLLLAAPKKPSAPRKTTSASVAKKPPVISSPRNFSLKKSNTPLQEKVPSIQKKKNTKLEKKTSKKSK